MHDFAFIDETLDINLTQSYQLSIQVSLNGLSFCILDLVRNKYIALVNRNIKEIEFNDFLNTIEKILEKNDLLSGSYKSIKLNWISTKNTLIPSKLFSESNLKANFEFNQKLDELDEIHYKKVKYIDAYSVFSIPSQLASIFIKKFPNVKIYSQQIPSIENIFFKHHSEAKKIFIDVNNKFIDVAISQSGNLILNNNFSYKSEMDIVYYVMNIYNQFHVNSSTTEVILSGLINKKSESYLKLKDFIGHIKFAKLPEDFSFSYTFNKIPNHSFINLFNLNHCE